jgi:hypothetical protein
MKWAYLVAGIILVATPSAAQKIDKAKVLETTRRDCPVQIMQDKKLIDALLIGGGNLTNFCECLAVRFATQLDDADAGNETVITAKFEASRKFCLVASIK